MWEVEVTVEKYGVSEKQGWSKDIQETVLGVTELVESYSEQKPVCALGDTPVMVNSQCQSRRVALTEAVWPAAF